MYEIKVKSFGSKHILQKDIFVYPGEMDWLDSQDILEQSCMPDRKLPKGTQVIYDSSSQIIKTGVIHEDYRIFKIDRMYFRCKSEDLHLIF